MVHPQSIRGFFRGRNPHDLSSRPATLRSQGSCHIVTAARSKCLPDSLCPRSSQLLALHLVKHSLLFDSCSLHPDSRGSISASLYRNQCPRRLRAFLLCFSDRRRMVCDSPVEAYPQFRKHPEIVLLDLGPHRARFPLCSYNWSWSSSLDSAAYNL